MTAVRLDFAPDDAVFVVFSGKAAGDSFEAVVPTEKLLAEVSGPWKVNFNGKGKIPEPTVMDNLAPLTESSNPDIKYFSGKAEYSTTFTAEAPKEGENTILDLGDVRDIAVVKVNGTYCGTIWKEPYKVEITNALRTGENQLEITVINPWHNRLVGDVGNPSASTFTSYKFFNPESPLLPSGLIGPVKIEALVN